ncbi:MAG: hypothetical protein KH496_13395 [Alistipes sp.]|nr:hypothetical protein [Alistipes sp.]
MRDRDVGKVRIDDLYNLIIVVGEFLKLEIKVIQTSNKLHFGRVTFNDNELLGEDAFYDKPAAVMFQSCLTKHLLKADILFRGEFEIIPVDSGICRCRASDQGTARCCLATTKIRAGESLREVLKILRYGFHSRVCSRCNITTVSGQKKAIGADWSGLERTSEPKRFTLLYIAAGLIIRATARIAK